MQRGWRVLHRRLVVSWAGGALRRSQIHDTFDSVAMRAVLLPGAGDEAQMLTLKQQFGD